MHTRFALLLVLGLLSHSAVATLNDAVLDAAREGDIKTLQSALASGSQINDKGDDGYSLLILAIYHHQLATASWLLSQGADPNQADIHGRTALMGAAFKGDMDAAKVLLADPRTDLNMQNRAGQTAVMYAALFGHQTLLEYFVQQGSDLNIKDKRGNTAESLAQSQGLEKIVAWIQALK